MNVKNKKESKKVVSLMPKLERWSPFFKNGDVEFSISSNCRLRIVSNSGIIEFSTVDTVAFAEALVGTMQKNF